MATIRAAAIARLHTILAASAFASALVIGCALHYRKIVKNGVAGYPQEWFPSVSATIGDWYPERNVFQILIALTSGRPRFAIVFLQYFLHHSATSSLSTFVFLSGIIRTLSCGGWVYITSSDDHDIHDFMMILYIVCNVPWMLLGVAATPAARVSVRRKRKLVSGAFFATIVPLVYFFIQHKVHRIPGAYTRYAFFEWGLIFLDVFYDSISEQEFSEVGLQISLAGLVDGASKVTRAESIPSELSAKLVDTKFAPAAETFVKADKPLADAVHAALDPAPEDRLADSQFVDNVPIWRGALAFLSDVYLSYIFWTLFTALIPTLFYFSVWKLGIAGNELALLSVLSPLLLSISSPYNYIFTYFFPSPGARLVLVSLGNIIGVMREVVAWSGIVHGGKDVGYQSIGLGATLASVLKQANRSNNPVWPFINHKADGWNKTGLFLALLAIYEYATRPTPKAQPTSPPPSSGKPQPRPSAFLSALPLGSLLFCIHNLLSDSSTLIAWSWTGYENRLPRGPVPHLHGSVTISAMVLGTFIALWSVTRPNQKPNPFATQAWFMFGSASAYVMYAYRNWTGYVGGLSQAVFLMSILPLVFQKTADAAVGGAGRELKIVKVYTIAFAVYCVLNLASVFTVAYAFVPGGLYFRERTDLVTIVQMACLLPAFNLGIFSTGITTPSLAPLTTKFRSHIMAVLSAISLFSLLTTVYRVPRTLPQPFKAAATGPRIINTGIWTVHFGIDNEGHDSQRGIMKLITDMELDVVGLLETDLHRTAFGHRDLTRRIVEEANYYVDIGPGPNSHTWGAVLLSKFPIISTKHHLLPSPHGELAPAIEAILDVYGTEVLVLVSHNGQEEDPLDRELQSTALAKILAASTRPSIFLGYVVTKPYRPRPDPYGIFILEGNVHDIDVDDADRWCEYIFYRGLYRTAYARVSRGIITDTETQIGQFVLPRHGHNVTDDSLPARYLRSRKEDLPVEHWFPMEYYGDANKGGVNGHYYHVFGTPLYYKLPEGAIV
ncbi:hypothetical protein NLJ89_g6510 [Agrocybe chaxingu]|uniref:Uncharacterized protein n=1 Tax=Agrocybe chaxingu TaxID=84603 RepID=A0A9W8MSM3_9AGAR|nr:hypothetical protein NLJ89_g6510 [Agrocybe chaxingu]